MNPGLFFRRFASPNLAALSTTCPRIGGLFMGLRYNGFFGPSHEISGDIAVQYKQFNYKAGLWLGLVLGLALASRTAFSQGITDRNKPEPILSGTANGPCDAALDQPELRPGTDVLGNPVAPADLEKSPVPGPGQVLIPLKGNSGGYVVADGKKLDPLLNPRPSCK